MQQSTCGPPQTLQRRECHMTSWVKSEGPAGRAAERMGWCDHSAAFILRRHSGRQIWMVCSLHCELQFVSGSTPAHDSPHNNIYSNRSPPPTPNLFFFLIHSIGDAIFLLLKRKPECSFFWCIFLKKQKLETETEKGQAGNDTPPPPPMRGAFPGVVFLPASHSYTAITFECVRMISASRYAWVPNGVLAQRNVRKVHTGKLCSRLSGRFCSRFAKICIDQ